MEVYFIDCIWILLTIASVAITSQKIITNNFLFQQLATRSEMAGGLLVIEIVPKIR